MTLNTDSLTLIMLSLMLISAILIVFTDKLFNAVIYMGVLSGITAFVFLLLGAPDVALAEIVIGSSLSTIIYLVAIKKFKIYTVYCTGLEKDKDQKTNCIVLIKAINDYLKTKEMQLHIINSDQSYEKLSHKYFNSMIIEVAEKIYLHGNIQEQHTQEIKKIAESIKDCVFCTTGKKSDL